MNRSQFLRLLFLSLLVLLALPLKVLADMVPRVFKTRRHPLPITPVEEFYIEDYSGPPKSLRQGADHWRLTIKGKVDHPLTLDYRQILARPSVKRIITMNCIGNPVGGRAIGTAAWQGISLKDLLDTADPHFFSNTLILRAEDGYYESIPLRKARHPGAMLAYKMNGKPLTLNHGFPLRLLIPGLYGIKQMKWIVEIEVADHRPKGYWHKKGWSKQAKVKIISRIDLPENNETLFTRKTVIRGIAFAGDRGIQYVQVSIDGEKTWSLAQLEKPLSSYSWVFWKFPCIFHRPGRTRIAVRAADQYSGLQQDDLRDPFPSGTSGIHRIEVLVS
ncbi:MAG: molybdopterin-dependent oxidoreductase [Nitrospinae bacterium]|nr:molybdopterin-dependent oxidoreductase [Nitrospinota bacterium]